MQNETLIRASTALLTTILMSSFATNFAMAAEPPQKKLGEFDADDGTYAIEIVTSVEDCYALCKADKETCTGTVVYQDDISKPEMQCRLNNGLGENSSFQREKIEILDYDIALSEFNAYRASKGLKALRYDERLNRASEVHARDLASAGILSHTGTDGSGHGDRIQLQGYYFSIAAENAAAGQRSWASVFQGWKDSPGHNENMLRDDVSEFGLAFVSEPTSRLLTYWVMVLAEPIDINAPQLSE